MKLHENAILKQDGTRATAIEFWNWQKTNKNTLNLRLLGLAKPQVEIISDAKALSIRVNSITEVGIFEETNAFIDNDYEIRENYWIPFDMSYFQDLKEIFQRNSFNIGDEVNFGKLFSIVSVCREFGIQVLDSADLANYEFDNSNSQNLELALPLYEYQNKGIGWLNSLYDQGIGGLLCDEMGLGKTVQAFGLIKHAISSGATNILVATPASLVMNWAREIEKFVPNLEYYLHLGPNRIFHPDDLAQQKVVIVSYDLLRRDFNNFQKIEWDLVVCDEAQALKNSESKVRNCISEITSSRKCLITGTPIENSLTDLWSLVDLVRPGLLGPKRVFQILVSDEISDARKLSKFASPLILRRTVKEVASELPELVTIPEALLGTDSFVSFYEEHRQNALEEKQNPLAIITAFTQICCYPRLIDESYSDPRDSKINRLLEILNRIKMSGEKAIIFSTFTQSLDLLKGVITNQLEPNYISVIDSRTPPNKRVSVIKNFEQIDGFAVLCIQPKAGGTGLNITGANHVIHFNRQWNPAIERQATARAYRRGQTKTVFEYLMYYVGTIEEYITETLDRKSELADHGNSEPVSEGSEKDVRKALSISPML